VNLIPVKNVLFEQKAQALGLFLRGQNVKEDWVKSDAINKASRQTAVTAWLKPWKLDASTNCYFNQMYLFANTLQDTLLQTRQQKDLLHRMSGPKLFNFPFTDFFIPLSLAAIRSDESVLPPPSLVRDTQIDLLDLFWFDNDDPEILPRDLIM
jgi:hypothetical protein